MDLVLKRRLDAITRKLDRDQKAAMMGEIDSIIVKYSSKVKKKIPTRKEQQFERIKEKYNKWVDQQVSIKSQRLNIHPDNKEKAYDELRSSELVPKKETREVTTFSAGKVSKTNALANIEHAITRMKTLMSKTHQRHKINMSREALLTAFNYPTGSAEYNDMKKRIMSMNQEEWEAFAYNNRKVIGKVWDWYHSMMEETANALLGGFAEAFVGRFVPIAFATQLIEGINTVKAATRTARVNKLKAAASMLGVSIPTAKNNPITRKIKGIKRTVNVVKKAKKIKETVTDKKKLKKKVEKKVVNKIPGATQYKRVKRIKKKLNL